MWKPLLYYDKLAAFKELYSIRDGSDEFKRSQALMEVRTKITETLLSYGLDIDGVKNSAAFIASIDAMGEFFKNSIDADASYICMFLLEESLSYANRVEICILDDGSGIVPSLVGEYHYRTALCRDSHKSKDKLGGRNLGLAIVAKLLDGYEGHLILNNRTSKGAHITLSSSKVRCGQTFDTVLDSISSVATEKFAKLSRSSLNKEDTILSLPTICGPHRVRQFSVHGRKAASSMSFVISTSAESMDGEQHSCDYPLWYGRSFK